MANEEIKAHNLEITYKAGYELCLQCGINKITKEMLSKKSGISRRSLDRYFKNKVDCVIQITKWFLTNLKHDISYKYPDKMFTDGTYTGAELLRMYMQDIQEIFLSDPRIFILYSEFKLYIYRNCDSDDQSKSLLVNWLGTHSLRIKIFNKGKEDGSLPQNLNVHTEEEYFAESFFGFLSNLAVSYQFHSEEETKNQIKQRIDNTIDIYTRMAKANS